MRAIVALVSLAGCHRVFGLEEIGVDARPPIADALDAPPPRACVLDGGLELGTGSAPIQVILDDIVGGAELDLIVTASSANAVIVHEFGAGAFGTQRTLELAAPPVAAVVRDLDDNGFRDVQVISTDNLVTAFLQDVNFAGIPQQLAGTPTGITTSDWDTDQRLETAIAYGATNTISATEDGTGEAHDFTTDEAPKRIEAIDGDLDGKSDFAYLTATGFGVVLSSLSYARKTYAGPVGALDYTIASLDADGAPDAALAISNPSGYYLIFGNSDERGVAVNDKPTAIDAVDIDADGDNDLAIAFEGKKTLEIFLNDGNASFTHVPEYDRATGSGSIDIAHGDIDRDGGVDLVVANKGSSTITVIRCIPNL